MIKLNDSEDSGFWNVPIMFSELISDLLLAQPNFAEILALYYFYYYTSKWQKTNRPKATNNYTAKGLQWSLSKVKKYKMQLINLGLIENVQNRNSDGSIEGHYIKVNFIWTQKAYDKTIKTSTRLDSLLVVTKPTNSLSNNNINSLSKNKRSNLLDSFLDLFPEEFQKDKTFQTAINEYIIHRKEKGKKLTDLSCQKLAKKLSTFSIPVCVEAINIAIESGWIGIFPESIQIQRRTINTSNRSRFNDTIPKMKYKE